MEASIHHERHAVYLHIVWSTKYREPTIPRNLQRAVYYILRSEAQKMGSEIIAVNGTDAHVHVLVHVGPTVAIARLGKQMKGVSAWFVNKKQPPTDKNPAFHWQGGYGVASIGVNQIARIVDYIDRQKEHHATNATHAAWEPTPDHITPTAQPLATPGSMPRSGA